ncbi:GlxA family transcriptional regulator [Dactylosporangium sp. NPDC051541]|uniref:GlxA family transcriptional regulator n=1 Tax=Dactylosporangium sp. NPDC051541 TaxID=3363977 RepID=UPI0037B6B65C
MSRHRIVVLLFDQVLPLDFAIPMHVFAREAPAFYDVTTATVDGRPVAAAGGLRLTPDGDLHALRSADTVVIPGYADAVNTMLDAVTLGALRAAAGRGARMVSICSGAFALAQAGLLRRRPATTHWALCAELARQFPDTAVDPAALFVDDGTVLTSGGVLAGVDLALHILRRDLGPAVANQVARRIVAPPQREGDQAQFVESAPVPPGDDPIAAAQQWMLAVLDRPVTVAQMAAHARLSPRQFHRRFVDRTQLTPLVWLHRQRIARTKELLETTSLTVQAIATRVGLGTSANLRQHFRRAMSISPTRHRRLFTHGGARRP